MKWYCDLWPGQDMGLLTLVQNPGPKMEGAVRVRIDLDLPEIEDPDHRVTATAEVEDAEDADPVQGA